MTNRKNIIKTSAQLFKVNGFKKTSIRDIVLKSDISTGQFYKHFKDKESLLKAVHFNEILNELCLVDPIADKHNEPLLKLALDIDFILSKVQMYEIYAESIINLKNDFLLSDDFLNQIDNVVKISLKNYVRTLTDCQIRNNNILIQGMIKNIINAYLKGHDSDLEDKKDLLISSALKIYDVPHIKIEALMSLLNEVRSQPDYITLMAQTF